jgi:hypothetical protein
MPFGIVHDARDENAGLRLVEVPHRQPHHVFFDTPAHISDGLLRGHPEELRQAERRNGAHNSGPEHDPGETRQQLGSTLEVDIVDQDLGDRREDQTGQAADEHQHNASGQAPPPHVDQLARFRPRGGPVRFLLFRG